MPGTPTGLGADWAEASSPAPASAAAAPVAHGGTPPALRTHTWVPGAVPEGVSGDAACAARTQREAINESAAPAAVPDNDVVSDSGIRV